MSACTFFGHRDCPSSIKPKLREALIDLIENHTVDMFYVGQQGAFDSMVRSVLKELVPLYPHINYVKAFPTGHSGPENPPPVCKVLKFPNVG